MYFYGSDDPTVRDRILGTDDGDSIYLYAGDDLAKGGFGGDWIYGGDGLDTLYGGFNDDDLEGGEGVDRLYGESGDDDLAGGGSRDLMDGGSGDDALDVGGLAEMNKDTVEGGTGIDTLYADYSEAGKRVIFDAKDPLDIYAAPGGFTVTNVERFYVTGTAFADILGGWKHDDSLQGGDGGDRLNGHGGRDTLEGGNGDDVLVGGAGRDSFYGDGYLEVGADNISGGAGDDYADGGEGDDKIAGENGDDTIYGEENEDNLTGGEGDDDIYGGTGSDTINGGSGNDFLASNYYSIYVYGADNGSEKDILVCGNGNDSAAIGVGDQADGGAGFDAIRMSFNASTTGVNFVMSTAAFTLANGASFTGFEVLEFEGGSGKDKVTGEKFDDTISGGANDDQLAGADGDDELDGDDGADLLTGGDGHDVFYDSGTGNDTFLGGAGEDTFHGGDGADSFAGEAGDDIVRLDWDDGARDEVNGGIGFDLVDFYPSFDSVYLDLERQTANDGTARGDTYKNIEHFNGTIYDDVLLGDAASNWLQGGGSDDVLDGRGGADWLDGGWGSDELTGGAGADVFVLYNGDEFLGTDWPADHITDFVRGTDKLEISLYEFNFAAVGDFRIVNNADPVPADGLATFLFETDTHRLWFDNDGTGEDEEPYLIATLDGVNLLAASDFSFVP